MEITMDLAYYGVYAGLAALVFAAYLFVSVLKEDAGNAKMKEISQAIYEGAMAYLNRQYKTLVPFTLIVFAILWYFTGWEKAISFIVGAACSAIAGYVGMTSTTKANARTTQAARTSLNKALNVSFKAGSVMGMSVAGLGLLGVSLLFIIFKEPHVIDSFAFGASAIAFFARIGGGIFTKAADVGADLVGKVEAGIPEDDPRNPAVIADNVGDNVGDTAGMGADLFESYGATAMAAMLLGVTSYQMAGVMFPLLLGAVGIVASIISTFLVHTSEKGNPQSALNRGLWGTNIITAVAAYFLCNFLFADNGLNIFYAVIAGLVVNIAIGYLTEYYTANTKKPVLHIADSAKTGPATTIITGIAVGMESTFAPILVFCAAILAAFHFAGMYGIAVAAMGMLSTAATIVAIDSFGPVADNAGGIAEMAGLEPEVRERTDRLDAVGNTTAAIAKGFSIGSAALTALALFAAYMDLANKNLRLKEALNVTGDLAVNLTDPYVIVGILIGGAVAFLVGSLTMEAVGKAAFEMIEEVRRQFREIPGIMEGKNKPDYAKCVDISTAAAIREMVLPGVVAVGAPLAIGFGLGFYALSGYLVGIMVVGVLLALFMSNAGGAWDNAKKYVESGHLGGKGTDVHAATVIGDTVGDPFKDTSGPAMNPLMKVAGTFALIIAPLLFR